MDTQAQAIIAISLAVGIIVAAIVYRNLHRRSATPIPLPVPIPDVMPFEWLAVPGHSPLIRSVVDIPTDALNAMRDGIQTQIDCVAPVHPDWTVYADVGDYVIYLIDPMATNVETDPGSPALIRDGIQCAGTCLGVGDGFADSPLIVLPHQRDTNWTHLEYLKQSARNESEHVRLFGNSPTLFAYYQGPNDVHPIFP